MERRKIQFRMLLFAMITVFLSFYAGNLTVFADVHQTSEPKDVVLSESEAGSQLEATMINDEYTLRTIAENTGTIHQFTWNKAESDAKAYLFSNHDLFYQQRSYQEGSLSFVISAKSCTVRVYQPLTKEWILKQIEKDTSFQTMVHVTFDEKEWVLCPSYAWKQLENGSIRLIPAENGSVNFTPVEGGYRVTLQWPTPTVADYSDYFFLASEASLIDWSNQTMATLWKGYQFIGDNRWCYDGFYYKSPSSYSPTGVDVYYLNPAAFTPSCLIKTGGSRAGDELGIAMLDVLRDRYNEDGYFPSYAKSNWLAKDYLIEAGYFDDRFNTDLASAYYVAYRKFGISEFSEIYHRYADFIVKRTNENYYTVKSATTKGKMLQDYWSPKGNKGTHCSLNHQAAVTLFLFKTQEAKYTVVAEQLLAGIKITRDGWIKKDGNLHYAFLSTGKFGMTDYPYLTYNDLYLLQEYIKGYKGKEDPDLALLMKSKKLWMDQNKITGYYR